MMDALTKAFDVLSEEMRECYNLSGGIEVINVPTSLEFADLVARNKPVLIKNAIDHWDALHKWQDSSYLRDIMGDNSMVTVDCSPDAKYDNIVGDVFVTPFVKTMKFNIITQLVTCTGQERFLPTREYVMDGADGAIFVGDSDPDKMDQNRRSFRELISFVAPQKIPYLVQLNKRDIVAGFLIDLYGTIFST